MSFFFHRLPWRFLYLFYISPKNSYMFLYFSPWISYKSSYIFLLDCFQACSSTPPLTRFAFETLKAKFLWLSIIHWSFMHKYKETKITDGSRVFFVKEGKFFKVSIQYVWSLKSAKFYFTIFRAIPCDVRDILKNIFLYKYPKNGLIPIKQHITWKLSLCTIRSMYWF